MKRQPLGTVFTVFVSGIAYFSVLIRIVESVNTRVNSFTAVNAFHSYQNCLWYVVITIFTIGYGDYYTRSVTGRAITCVTGIFGMVVISLIFNAFIEVIKFGR